MGARYIHKVLNSTTPENWQKVADIAANESVGASIVKLTKHSYQMICSDDYYSIAEEMFKQLARKPHLILVHEEVVGYLTESDEVSEVDQRWARRRREVADYWDGYEIPDVFGEAAEEVREKVHHLMDKYGLEVSTYKRNAEASILATSFIDDLTSNLLFRCYIPAGRIYEDEVARLFQLFHTWLGSVAGKTVRQGGYRTPNGRVIEFFGEEGISPETWSENLEQFSQFLTRVDDHDAAIRTLRAAGLSEQRADELTARFSRDARRILLDTRHERERRMLQIRQEFESEVSDETSLPVARLTELIDHLVPTEPTIEQQRLFRSETSPRTPTPPVVIIENQQVFSQVQGVVAQNLAGPVTVGAPPEQVLALIRSIGGAGADDVQVAARELADRGAPPPDRVRARQVVKSFFIRNMQRIEKVAFDAAMKWVEGQLG
jgi:hypothetical protein